MPRVKNKYSTLFECSNHFFVYLLLPSDGYVKGNMRKLAQNWKFKNKKKIYKLNFLLVCLMPPEKHYQSHHHYHQILQVDLQLIKKQTANYNFKNM